MGWQTIAKQVEREVNSLPIGYLLHQGEQGQLLKVIRPNLLKLNTSSERAPAGIFQVPDRPQDLMHKIEDAYKLFYKLYNEEYVPILAKRSKWHDEEEDLKENDIVFFKLRDSPMSATWLIGKVEYVKVSRDGKVRKFGVSYKHDTTNGTRVSQTIERPVREVVKLMNIEDTTLLDDIKLVQEEAQR